MLCEDILDRPNCKNWCSLLRDMLFTLDFADVWYSMLVMLNCSWCQVSKDFRIGVFKTGVVDWITLVELFFTNVLQFLCFNLT